MARLWDKGDALDPEILDYTIGDDPEVDLALVAEDCWGSLAHARMLEEQGLLGARDRRAIADGLRAVLAESRAGKFTIARDQEDVHTAIEARLGEAGKSVHTGRSRNDQVLSCLRLFAKRRLLDVEEAAAGLA